MVFSPRDGTSTNVRLIDSGLALSRKVMSGLISGNRRDSGVPQGSPFGRVGCRLQ